MSSVFLSLFVAMDITQHSRADGNYTLQGESTGLFIPDTQFTDGQGGRTTPAFNESASFSIVTVYSLSDLYPFSMRHVLSVPVQALS